MKRLTFIIIAVLSVIGFSNCSSDKSSIVREDWGAYKDKPVYRYTITNSKGSVMKVINYGAIITSVNVPDKNGVYEEVVMGFDSFKII
jgi:aldose 1-epimerase